MHSEYFYSSSSSPLGLLLRGAPDTARIGLLCRSFTPRRHRQLRVKNLPKVPMWWQERDSNTRPSGRQLSTQPMSRHVAHWLTLVPLTLNEFACSLRGARWLVQRPQSITFSSGSVRVSVWVSLLIRGRPLSRPTIW